MFKRKQDYLFLFSLVFIITFGGYLIFDKVQQHNLDSYLGLLHDSLAEMITDEQEKANFENFFNAFITTVKNDSLSSGDLEQFAENIIDLKLENEKISTHDIQKILPRSKINRNPLLLNSAFILNNIKTDWLAMAKEFKKANIRCDSTRKEKLERISYKKQIDFQEDLSSMYHQRSIQSKRYIEEKKDELVNIEMDSIDQLKRIEEELLIELNRIKAENSKLNLKLNSINMLEQLIAKERNSLKTDLTRIDSARIE